MLHCFLAKAECRFIFAKAVKQNVPKVLVCLLCKLSTIVLAYREPECLLWTLEILRVFSCRVKNSKHKIEKALNVEMEEFQKPIVK